MTLMLTHSWSHLRGMQLPIPSRTGNGSHFVRGLALNWFALNAQASIQEQRMTLNRQPPKCPDDLPPCAWYTEGIQNTWFAFGGTEVMAFSELASWPRKKRKL